GLRASRAQRTGDARGGRDARAPVEHRLFPLAACPRRAGRETEKSGGRMNDPTPLEALPDELRELVAAGKQLGGPGSDARARLLLDAARSTLVHGDSAGALRVLDQHRARFADGQLAEEREALAIQALAGGGQWDEARQRAKDFATMWPKSLFAPAIEAVLDAG